MNIKNNNFYYFTLDLDYKEIIKCKFIRQFEILNAAKDREAILVKLHEKSPLGTEYLILLPRSPEQSFFKVKQNEMVSAYVCDGKAFKNNDTIDIKDLEGKTIDIGGLSPSLEVAMEWVT